VTTLLFGSPERARRGTRALTIAACICVPGLVLGAFAAAHIWRHRQPPPSTRWGWSVVGALAFLYMAPLVQWRWPGQVVAGTSFGSLIGCTVAEMLIAPMALQAFTWLREPLPRPLDDQGHPTAPDMTVVQDPDGRPHETSMAPPSTVPGGTTAPAPSEKAASPLPRPGLSPSPSEEPRFRLGADRVGRPVDITLTGEASVLILGLPGTGKSTTLIRLTSEALRLGWCAIICDLKGSGLVARSIRGMATQHTVPLYTIDRSDPHTLGYNPCAGTASDIGNRLVGAFTFTGIAAVYQQVALDAVTKVAAAVEARDGAVTLGALVAALQVDEMAALGRAAANATKGVARDAPDYVDYIAQLNALSTATRATRLLQEGVIGIQKRLSSLDSGTFGTLLRHTPSLDWDAITAQPSLTYVSMPVLASPSDVELLGRVMVQDIKQLADRRLRSGVRPKCLLILDEFGALNEPSQVIDLILQGREAGITTVASTQFVPATPALSHALLGAGVVIAHRVASADAELLASQFGTVPSIDVATQVDYQTGEVTRGTVRRGQTYAITPDQFRNLAPGDVALRVTREAPALRHRIVHITREEM